MTPEFKAKLVEEFKKRSHRDPSADELVNAETDHGLIQAVLLREYEAMKVDVEKIKKIDIIKSKLTP